ncbi:MULTISPECIES: fumarylacetoacetate hydrolase family protein [unclassified Paenibacillus]|uniref:fumarylacetoacetate hydrolase family protein n=1 Tax=unclassified Paenibacillus TaxID=185978 RepID=UPI001144BD45|nr:fumarylacetoacetate hydrolase family protein [Paenibacillus sp. tmac-D7]
MKFARFTAAGDPTVRSGVVVDGTVQEIVGNVFETWNYTGNSYALESVQLVAPLQPRHIIGIGKNYVEFEHERPQTLPSIPVFFFKPVSTVIGPGEEIIIPSTLEQVKFETEIAVILGKEGKNIPEDDVERYIFGYTVANDVASPEYFHPDGHWMVGKSFDTFTPLGPWIETKLDTRSLLLQTHVNGKVLQDSRSNLMIVGINHMISYLSRVMTLQPGDVILSGTPAGADFIKDGDTIECTVEGIGALTNKVVKITRTGATTL